MDRYRHFARYSVLMLTTAVCMIGSSSRAGSVSRNPLKKAKARTAGLQLSCSSIVSSVKASLVTESLAERYSVELSGHVKSERKKSNRIRCGVLRRAWGQDEAVIFLVSQAIKPAVGGGVKAGNLLLEIGIRKKDKWLAKTVAPIVLKDAGQVSSLHFARYRVTKSQFAFGVRWRRYFGYASGGGADLMLDLFLIKGKRIVDIMHSLMKSTSITAGNWKKDGTRIHHDNGDATTAVIRVLPTKTRGHFDLLKIQSRRKARYLWNGKKYILRGRDPVREVNISFSSNCC